MAVLANDGRRVAPHVVRARVGAGGAVQPIAPREAVQVVTPQTARTLSAMLAEIVADTLTEAALPGYAVAGKTGTSEVPSRFDPADNETIASFCGFLPADAPRAVVLVKVDRPQVDATGIHVAAPLFREVAEAVVQTLDIAPRAGLAMAPGGAR
jgi:cell division protein FtsI/penicillin-binding protein 2